MLVLPNTWQYWKLNHIYSQNRCSVSYCSLPKSLNLLLDGHWPFCWDSQHGCQLVLIVLLQLLLLFLMWVPSVRTWTETVKLMSLGSLGCHSKKMVFCLQPKKDWRYIVFSSVVQFDKMSLPNNLGNGQVKATFPSPNHGWGYDSIWGPTAFSSLFDLPCEIYFFRASALAS